MKSKTHYDDWYVKCWKGMPYPVTIIDDRYGVAYSKGNFLAFPIIYKRMSAGPDGDDIKCMSFWKNNKHIPVGKGNNPAEAYDDLVQKIESGTWDEGFTIIDDI